MAAQQLRVPRCEMLLANSAAKGTLRAGQLSQIPNVILAGGKDGMWTFDRYQRWMERKTDWVRQTSLRSPTSEDTAKVVNVPRTSGRPAAPTARRGAAEQQPEISIDEDIDPSEIAALARKIEERTPQALGA